MIETDVRDGVTIVRLAHGKASVLDIELLDALCDTLDAVAGDDSAAMVLTGSGSIFSAGVDLYRLVDGGRAYVERFLPRLGDAIGKLFVFPKPVVAAINGHAIAGGCILAVACDHRVMAAGKGRIGVPELLVGVPFPPLAVEVLAFSIPSQHLQPLLYSGSTHLPDEALKYGLVDEVVEPERLLERALEVAHLYGSVPANAFSATKLYLRNGALEQYRQRAAESDAETMRLWNLPETYDIIRGYLERTIPKAKA